MCDSKKASNPSRVAGVFFRLVAAYAAFPYRAASFVAEQTGCCAVRRALYTWCHMLWIKALHIVFVASWFAGLLYLPRIFVNLALVPPDSEAERQRLLLMARKLMRFTTFLAVPAIALGLWLWLGYGIGRGPGNGWMHAKLAVVVLAIGYHYSCMVILRKFISGSSQRSHVWFRWFNEVPVLLLLAAVVLVVVKPF